MQVAVLGTGRMGGALAERLLGSGHTVTVWNRTPARIDPLAARGARVARTPAAAVQDSAVIFMVLSADSAVREVVTDAVNAMGGDRVLVDCSTVSPDTTDMVAEQVDRFVAAPILGGPQAILNATTTLLVGGPASAVEAVRPILNAISSRIIECGAASNATTMKILSNLILISSTSVLAEAIAIAQRTGVDNDLLRTVFAESPVIGAGVRTRLENILGGDHSGWFTVDLAEKDLGLAIGLGQEVGLITPIADGARAELREAQEAGLGDQDLAAVVEVIRGD
ncbi:MAG TPA: NAD(P)-dependent oxidoreductase [Chloroflexota bacterium]|nr:NAD(P)-dependent oxidoreductase [Chloroflexota bacterium]